MTNDIFQILEDVAKLVLGAILVYISNYHLNYKIKKNYIYNIFLDALVYNSPIKREARKIQLTKDFPLYVALIPPILFIIIYPTSILSSPFVIFDVMIRILITILPVLASYAIVSYALESNKNISLVYKIILLIIYKIMIYSVLFFAIIDFMLLLSLTYDYGPIILTAGVPNYMSIAVLLLISFFVNSNYGTDFFYHQSYKNIDEKDLVYLTLTLTNGREIKGYLLSFRALVKIIEKEYERTMIHFIPHEHILSFGFIRDERNAG